MMNNHEPNIYSGLILRISIYFISRILSHCEPYERKISSEEFSLYKYPHMKSYITYKSLLTLAFSIPLIVILINYKYQKDKTDVRNAILSFTLAMGSTMLLTNILKLSTGRLRPDFFWRCFPNGKMTSNLKCTGRKSTIREGRKSFPSGHSSTAFASMGFLTLYLLGKLRITSGARIKNSCHLIACFLPLLLALCVAVSRIYDYHHHKVDVLCGSFIGLFFAYISHIQYFPKFDLSVPNIV